jgi:hypothetical protein
MESNSMHTMLLPSRGPRATIDGLAFCFLVLAAALWDVPSAAGQSTESGKSASSKVEVEHGKPNRFLDGIGWVVGIPEKVLLWDRRVDNHEIGERTEGDVVQYLAENNLDDVKVRVNQYAPIDEWRRLRQNTSVSPLARYTFGTVHWIGYTVLPDRIFGGDKYNPYTNSISVSSDVPSLAVREAAYAKDVHERQHPSLYAVSQELPGLSLWHDTRATKSTLNYYESARTPDEGQEANRILTPRYGADVGGAVDSVVRVAPIGTVTGALVGHAVALVSSNKTAASNAESER